MTYEYKRYVLLRSEGVIMPDILIVGLAAIAGICLIRVYSNKPQDADGKLTLSTRDQILGWLVIILMVGGIAFVKIGMYGLGNPLIFASPILIGAYVIYSRIERKKK